MYKKIITALAISVLCPLAALAQYDGAPMQKPSEKKKRPRSMSAETNTRTLTMTGRTSMSCI